MMGKYILDEDGNPCVCEDVLVWAQWFETADRRVADDRIGDAHISTVFLGLDHNFGISSEPLLFETMVFGGSSDGTCRRYATKAEAVRGHHECVKEARSHGLRAAVATARELSARPMTEVERATALARLCEKATDV